MGSPYRQDVVVVRERRAVVIRELHAAESALDRLDTERGVLVRELELLEERLSQARLTKLDTLQIASPCSADWRKMDGDDVVRRCGECNKDVHDISAMTEAEALAFVGKGGDACVRLFRRADGRVMTADCSVAAQDKRRRLRILAACSIPIVIATVAAVGASHARGQVVMGGFSTEREHDTSYKPPVANPEHATYRPTPAQSSERNPPSGTLAPPFMDGSPRPVRDGVPADDPLDR